MSPGDICVMRCLGETIRVRVCGQVWNAATSDYRPGWLRVQYVDDQPSTTMGRCREYVNARRGRLRPVMF